MHLFESKPTKTLQNLINRYLLINADKSELPVVRILPTGYIYLTHVSDEPALAKVGLNTVKLPEYFIGGQITLQEVTLFPQKKFCHFGIEFKPQGFYQFFGIDMGKTINKFTNFEENNIKKELVTDFKSVFKNNKTFIDRCESLNNYFNNLLPYLHSCPDVEMALDLIERKKGNITVVELAGKTNYSVRNFRRRFKKVCGISPPIL